MIEYNEELFEKLHCSAWNQIRIITDEFTPRANDTRFKGILPDRLGTLQFLDLVIFQQFRFLIKNRLVKERPEDK